jgi:hypothetical protein
MDDTPTNTPTNTSSTGSNDWASVMDIDSSNLGYMFVVGEGLQQRAFNIEGLTVSANDQLVINNIPVRAAADLVIARGVVRGFMREHGGEWHLVDTFDQSVRTIVALRPRIAIMENVLGLLKTGCIEQVREVLDVLDGYKYALLKLDSTNFDLPHHRERVYVICLRSDALRVPADKALAQIKLAIVKSHHRCQVPFVDWLATMQLPILSPKSPPSPCVEM